MATPDSRLLKRARENDAEALAEIYDLYAESIYRYLYRYLGDAAQAEDLTSEVFLKLLQALNTPRAPRDHLQGWLYRVAHNQAMDWFRRRKKDMSDSLEFGPDGLRELVATSATPLNSLEKRQSQQQLREAIRKLTRDQQHVILLRFGEGLKCRQVAELIGKSEGAVKILQHRAVKRLQKLLDQEEK